jgi:hypothetical protein
LRGVLSGDFVTQKCGNLFAVIAASPSRVVLVDEEGMYGAIRIPSNRFELLGGIRSARVSDSGAVRVSVFCSPIRSKGENLR